MRLQLDLPDEASAQEEPFALNHLEKYLLTQTITKASDPTQALQRLRLSGELAIAGFGQAQESLLLEQREELLARFDLLVNDWPNTLTVQTQNWVFDAHSLNAEWANGQHIWRTNADASAWLQVEMRPGSILEGQEKNKQARVEKLTTLWLNHLVACASGTPTTSVQIGLNGMVRLDAITQKDAHTYLHDLVLLYAQAWQQPLPVACKSACKYLSTLNAPKTSKNESPDQLHAAALFSARQAFEDGHTQTGEFTKSASLQRVFKNFADIEADLPHWAQRLYGAMVEYAKLVSATSNAKDEESAL